MCTFTKIGARNGEKYKNSLADKPDKIDKGPQRNAPFPIKKLLSKSIFSKVMTGRILQKICKRTVSSLNYLYYCSKWMSVKKGEDEHLD